MYRHGLWVLMLAGLCACGSSQKEEQPPPSATTTGTELSDAVQAPLQRAESVQQTMDEQGAKLDEATRAAFGDDEGMAPGEDDEGMSPGMGDDEDDSDEGDE